MSTNIKTVMTYPLNGSTTDFVIPFEYLARKFVVVTLIGVDRKQLVLITDYRFATKSTISLNKAWGPGDGYASIEIRRFTSATDRLVDFTDGSILRAYDLNVSQIQTLHVAEEARDLTADTIGVNNDGNLDARGRRIVNVADAVEGGDAVSLGQIQRWNDSALNSSIAAKASEGMAERWANADEDSPVIVGSYSAKHHAIKASKSASAAKTSEANSKTSETAASNSATNSANSASASSGSATQAGNSATTATTQAGIATSKALEASQSAVNAKADADRAQSANPDEQLKKAQNLNDLPNKATSRANLGVPLVRVLSWRDAVAEGFIEFLPTLSSSTTEFIVEVHADRLHVKGLLRVTGNVIANLVLLYRIKSVPMSGFTNGFKVFDQVVGNGAPEPKGFTRPQSQIGSWIPVDGLNNGSASTLLMNDVWYFK